MINNNVMDYKSPRNDNPKANLKRQRKIGRKIVFATFGMIVALLVFQNCSKPSEIRVDKNYNQKMQAEAKYRANKMLNSKNKRLTTELKASKLLNIATHILI